MAHGVTKQEQWSAEPLKLGAFGPCCSMQPVWPHKMCNRPDNHEGDHCCKFQAGTKVVEVWWSRDLWKSVATN